MTACEAYDSLICPLNWSGGKYSFDYVPVQPVITHIEMQTGIPESHPEEYTVEVTMDGKMVYY